MIPIVVIGSPADSKNIHGILSGITSCGYVGRDCIKLNFNRPDELCIYSFDEPPKAEISSAVAIFTENSRFEIKRILPDGFHIIACDGEKAAESIALGSPADVITCGFSEKDCLTISSNLDGSAVVSVKQNIKTISENIIEPSDIVIHNCDGTNDSILLFAIAALIVCDKLDGGNIIDL